MKLVIGSYVLDGVSSTAYEQFITYYQTTPASYITNNDIDRWNTPTDLSDYASKSYVIDKIDAIPAPDLTPYATVSYVNEKIGGIVIPDVSTYVTYTYLEEKNYLTEHQDLSAYAKFEDISQMGYITEHQDLSGYVSKQELDSLSYATQSYVTDKINSMDFNIDTTGLVNETRLQEYVSGAIAGHSSSAYTTLQNYTDQKISDLNITSYATKDWVTEHITEIASGGQITLDGYATELWVNNQGFLKQNALSNYVTSSIMSAALNSYMKKSDMISYATQEWVNNAILNAAIGEVDLSNYALKSEIPSLNNYYNKQYIDNNLATKAYVTAKVLDIASGGEITLDGYATETWVNNNFLHNNALNNYYTKSQVDAKIPNLSSYVTFDWIEGYYNQYVKDYCDTFNTDGTNLLNYVSKEELDGLSYVTSDELSSMGYITQHQSLTDYVTKTELSAQSYLTEHQSLTDYPTFSDISSMGYITSSDIPASVDLSSYATISYVTDKFSEDENVWAAALVDLNTRMASYVTSDALSQMGYITQNDIPQQTIDLSSYVTKSELNSYVVFNINKTYDGPLKIYSQGIQVNNQYGHISPVNYSYANFISADTNAWMSKGSVVNYVNGRIAEIEASYATESYVTTKIAEASIGGGGSTPDLSNYVTKTELDSMGYITAQNVIIDENIIPKTNNTYTLGNNDYIYANTYTRSINLGTNIKILSESSASSNDIAISLDNTSYYYINKNRFAPNGSSNSGKINLGTSDRKWDGIYANNIEINDINLINGWIKYNGSNCLGILSNRIIPSSNNTLNLGVEAAAWANTYSYNFYSYTSYGWMNISETLKGLETLLSQI